MGTWLAVDVVDPQFALKTFEMVDRLLGQRIGDRTRFRVIEGNSRQIGASRVLTRDCSAQKVIGPSCKPLSIFVSEPGERKPIDWSRILVLISYKCRIGKRDLLKDPETRRPRRWGRRKPGTIGIGIVRDIVSWSLIVSRSPLAK